VWLLLRTFFPFKFLCSSAFFSFGKCSFSFRAVIVTSPFPLWIPFPCTSLLSYFYYFYWLGLSFALLSFSINPPFLWSHLSPVQLYSHGFGLFFSPPSNDIFGMFSILLFSYDKEECPPTPVPLPFFHDGGFFTFWILSQPPLWGSFPHLADALRCIEFLFFFFSPFPHLNYIIECPLRLYPLFLILCASVVPIEYELTQFPLRPRFFIPLWSDQVSVKHRDPWRGDSLMLNSLLMHSRPRL